MFLVFSALCWAAGILTSANPGMARETVWLRLLGFALVPLGVAFLFRARVPLKLSFGLILFALGGFRFTLSPQTSDLAQYNDLGGYTVEGVIAQRPQTQDGRARFQMRAETITFNGETIATDGALLVNAFQIPGLLQIGDRVRATGILRSPAREGAFSYADYLARSEVFSLLTRASVETLPPSELPFNLAFGRTLADWSRTLGSQMDSAIPEPYAGLMRGILLGDESGIAPATEAAFARTGASHLLVISGFNMTLLGAITLRTLKRLHVSSRSALFIALFVIAIYTLFVGASPSILRAALMSALLIIAQGIRRKTYLPTSIGFATMLLTLFNPRILWDIGFLLSVFATLGIGLFADPLSRALDRLLAPLPARLGQLVGDIFTEPLSATVAAQILTMPIILRVFGTFSVVALPVNLLVLPVQSIILILGIVSALVSSIAPVIGQMGYAFAAVPLAWTWTIIRAFSGLRGTETTLTMSASAAILFYLSIATGAIVMAVQPTWVEGLVLRLRARPVVFTAVGTIFCIGVLSGAVAFSRPDGMLHLWLIPARDAGIVFIQTPSGGHILIDGGDAPASLLTVLGERMPLFDRQIEMVVLTQPDEPNIAALPDVFARYTPSVIISNGQPGGTSADTIRTAYPNMQIWTAGNSAQWGDGVRIEALAPHRLPERGEAFNAHALTLRIRYGERSVLVMGELDREGQGELAEQWGQPVDLITATSRDGSLPIGSALIELLQPSMIALAGERSPLSDTIAFDRPLHLTDGGILHFWTDGAQWWMNPETF